MSLRLVSAQWWQKWRKEGLSHLQADQKLARLLGELEMSEADTESDSEDTKREVKRPSTGFSTTGTFGVKDCAAKETLSSKGVHRSLTFRWHIHIFALQIHRRRNLFIPKTSIPDH